MSTTMTLAERMQHAGTGTVIGVATVFAVLGLLLIILFLMQYIFSPKKEKKAETTVQSVIQPVAQVKTDDNEIIAVITAAVAAMFDAKGIKTNFKIKSFKRTK